MRMGWDCLSKYGPMYGYFVNSGKTWLVVKEDRFDEAQNVFRGTGVNITKEGKRHLGAALGCEAFVSQYVQQQAHKWASQVDHLADIAKPNLGVHMQPIGTVLSAVRHFLPALLKA